MVSVRYRLLILDVDLNGETPLNRAERFALHVRKIVEAVSFAALSATELKNANLLLQQRSKDASQLLAWLEHRKLLRLPEAQRLSPSSDPAFKAVFEGDPSANIGVTELQRMFSRASALLHERHPERLSQESLIGELQELEKDARSLRHWLWCHIAFLGGRGILVQMGMFGTASFVGLITRQNP